MVINLDVFLFFFGNLTDMLYYLNLSMN